jgi:hypothetical protein
MTSNPKIHRSTITLDQEAFSFLLLVGGANKSAFINALLKQEKQRVLSDLLVKANQEEAASLYQASLQEWDAALNDGLNVSSI